MLKKPILLTFFLCFQILALSANPAFSEDIVINEIHADPHNTEGDANGDGIRHSTQDEFIELVNASGSPIDISGWTLSDGVSVRHEFPAGTVLNANRAIVIFGGGSPTGSFGGAIVQTASSGQLALNNSGDTITLSDGVVTQAAETYGSAAGGDESLTRDPDISGSFVKHASATGSGGALFSPGTRINGSHFSAPAKVVTIADANLEQVIRDALGKPTGTIYDTDLESLTTLNARGQNIADLTGLEFATNLSELDLGDNQIPELKALENLTDLIRLSLDGNLLDSDDLPKLYDLDNLTHLNLTRNPGLTSGIAMETLGNELESLDCEDIIWEGVCGADPILADFVASETYGIAPLEVQFTDLSEGTITSWLWDFGDGETSEAQHPVHVYYGNRKHLTVTLTVIGPGDTQTVTKTNYITVNRAVEVLFEASPIVGAPGLEVQLTNNVGGSATHFSLNYGDGQVENFKQNFRAPVHPYHHYLQPGEFTVSLAAWGNGGADTLTLPGLIYIDDQFEYRKLSLVASGKTYPGLGWENAIDHDIFGDGATVAAESGDAWAIFTFRDSAEHEIQKIRLLTDSVDPEQRVTNMLSEFEIWISNDSENFGTEAAFKGTSTAKDGAWEIFLLNTPVSAKFLKVKLTAARGEQAKYREFTEIQFFSPPQNLVLAKETAEPVENSGLPASFVLEQNYPNPFNPETRIRFQLPETAEVQLSIYNIQGQFIRTLTEGNLTAGFYNFRWNAQDSRGEFVANGIYLYKLVAKGISLQTVLTKRMILMK